MKNVGFRPAMYTDFPTSRIHERARRWSVMKAVQTGTLTCLGQFNSPTVKQPILKNCFYYRYLTQLMGRTEGVVTVLILPGEWKLVSERRQ